MQNEDKKQSPRKAKNAAANEARHLANLAEIADKGIPSRESMHVKVRIGRDGKPFEQTVIKQVRPSKLIRTQRRAYMQHLELMNAAN